MKPEREQGLRNFRMLLFNSDTGSGWRDTGLLVQSWSGQPSLSVWGGNGGVGTDWFLKESRLLVVLVIALLRQEPDKGKSLALLGGAGTGLMQLRSEKGKSG